MKTPAALARIGRMRGILKRPPGGRSLAEEMAEHKRTEKALEEKNARPGRPRVRPRGR